MNDISFPAPPPPAISGKQSKVGIASFAVSILGVTIFCISMIISAVYGASIAQNNPIAAQHPFQAIDRSAPVFIIASILSWCGPIFSIVGIGLGIAALVQKTDKKTFGIIGLVIGGLVLLIFCLLAVIGIAGQLGSF